MAIPGPLPPTSGFSKAKPKAGPTGEIHSNPGDCFEAGPPTLELLPKSAPDSTLKSEAQVNTLVESLRAQSFPELEGRDIGLSFFKSDDYFFTSRPSIGSILNPFTRTRYVLGVNREVFDKQLPTKAAEAILAHELSHTLQYVKRGLLGMLDALIGEIHRGHMVHNERQTDMETIARGYADGLAEYREWIYPQLSPGDEKKKRQVYFSPEEIAALEEIRKTKPKLFQEFTLNPPKNLEEIRRAASSD